MRSDDTNLDAVELVRRGYDQIAEQYTEWAKSVRGDERERYTKVLLEGLPPGASVLDLGCGNGDPVASQLAQRFVVTGVDISERQIERAKANVPSAKFIQADMTQLKFPPAFFDGIATFYSITHVPRERHPALLGAIAEWLRPGGLLVASMSAGQLAGRVEDDWLGAPMYFSGYDPETNRQMVGDAGLTVLSAQLETAEEFGKPSTFLWIVARKSLRTSRLCSLEAYS